MSHNELHGQDIDPRETAEWLESLQAVIDSDGAERAHYLINQLVAQARHAGADLTYGLTTPYTNLALIHI